MNGTQSLLTHRFFVYVHVCEWRLTLKWTIFLKSLPSCLLLHVHEPTKDRRWCDLSYKCLWADNVGAENWTQVLWKSTKKASICRPVHLILWDSVVLVGCLDSDGSEICLSLSPSVLDYRQVLPCLAFFMDDGNPNSGPYACTVITSLTESFS